LSILTARGENHIIDMVARFIYNQLTQNQNLHRRTLSLREKSVLIIEDEDSIRENLSEILALHGYKVLAVNDGEAGLEAVKKRPPDVVLTDLKLPKMDGIEAIRAVKEHSPNTICIMLTGYATIETAVEAMKVGAFTYLQKPFGKDELLVTLDKAFELHSLKEENVKLRNEIKNSCTGAILGTSREIQAVCEVIEKAADTDSTAVILGESGTGKELVARALHYGSSRADKPFVPMNCGAIPEDLLESELFGFEKGAFTGAIATKIGRFEAADGGTIFLDEIGDMSPGLQVKILRVLQEKEFERLGGRNTIKVDVRVVAATNQDLEKAVEEKRFRKDLFYRLNVIPIALPALRERKEDIALLVKEFLGRTCARKKKNVKGVAPEAMRMLEAYDWPGNIRELENLIERIVVLKEDEGLIVAGELPDKIRKSGNEAASQTPPMWAPGVPPQGADFNAAVQHYERELILNALNAAGGVKKKAAEILRLNRTTLIEKMKRMRIIEPDSDKEPFEPSSSVNAPAEPLLPNVFLKSQS